jgi:TIGR03009 family protein
MRVAQQPSTPGGNVSGPANANGPGNATRPENATRSAPAGPGQPGAPGGPQAWRQGGAQDAGGAAVPGGQAGPPVTIAPKAPFQLTPEEEQKIDETLKTWEQKSDKISSFKCQFTRWDYDMAFGAPALKGLKSEGKGEIKYKAPDHGKYRLISMKDVEPQPDGKPAKLVDRDPKDLEHWVCDGDSIYEFKSSEKKLIQHKLPEEMRGKSISDGPLPFIFGAKADQIKRRYFVRLITPPKLDGKEVWIEAWPRFQVDAGNFQRVWIILSAPEYRPEALQIFLPGQPTLPPMQCSRTAYGFEQQIVNDPLSILKLDFVAPITPLNWKKVIEEAPTANTAPKPAPSDPSKQAQRDAAPVKRR